MPAIRTQIYLTRDQRQRLGERARRERKPLAQVIRDAVDAYLEGGSPARRAGVLRVTFGALPDLEVPHRGEWDRRGG